MIATFLRLFRLLTRKQKREFFILQFFMLMSAVAELASTFSIMPFIVLVSDPEIAQSNPYLSQLHRFMGEPSEQEFLFGVGVTFISLIVLSNSILMISQFLMNRYSFRVGAEISTRLFGYYLSRDMHFHSNTNSALLIQRIMRDSLILSASLITPTLRLNLRIFSIILLSSLVIYIDPLVALNTVLLLGFVYWFIFQFVRKSIHKYGKLVSKLGQSRNQILNESLGSIRDVKLHSFEHGYLTKYQHETKTSERASADILILGESPYFILEAIVMAGMVILTLYLYAKENNLSTVLPVLTLYAFAGVKLIPKIQQSYQAFTKIRSAQPVFSRVYPDLLASSAKNPFQNDTITKKITPSKTIAIKNLTFTYDPAKAPLFDDFSTTFTPGEITAITGESGAGKTTLLEILMGLVEPESGNIVVDGEPLSVDDMPAWRASIGYVPQEVYLNDSSPAQNIAFGISREEIDINRVEKVAKLARVHETIAALPQGYWTPIGERGSLLSGGQKQRIGIARALYRDVSVLFLDEATSALDAETQSEILTHIEGLTPDITVIMITHRPEPLQISNKVIHLKRTAVEDQPVN